MDGDAAMDSCKGLADLMLEDACAVGGPKEQPLNSVQSFVGLEDTVRGAVRGTWWNPFPLSSSVNALAPSGW